MTMKIRIENQDTAHSLNVIVIDATCVDPFSDDAREHHDLQGIAPGASGVFSVHAMRYLRIEEGEQVKPIGIVADAAETAPTSEAIDPAGTVPIDDAV